MKRDIAHDKRIRFYMRFLFTLFAFVIPIGIVAIKYDIITKFSGWKLGIMGFVFLISILYRFKTKLLEWINKWEYSMLKYILLGFSKIAIFILIVAIAHIARREASNVVFVLDWYLLSSTIAYLIIMPIEEHYDFHVKRELRKQEMREVRDE